MKSDSSNAQARAELRSCALVVDRGPGLVDRLGNRERFVVPVGSTGSYSDSLARLWGRAGYRVAQPRSPHSHTTTSAVRHAFDVLTTTDCEQVLSDQREALLAPEWPQILAWLPETLQQLSPATVIAAVRPWLLGAVETACRSLETCSVVSARASLRSRARYGRVSFIAGEVILKGFCNQHSGFRRNLRRDMALYAEVPNHFRQLSPVVPRLASQGVSVLVLKAAVAKVHAYSPPLEPGEASHCARTDNSVCSLDRLALHPRPLLATVASLRRSRCPEITGDVSDKAKKALARRARYYAWVYDKIANVIPMIDVGIVVMGDSAGHRTAAISHYCRRVGVPTVAMQHGFVADIPRYHQTADVFLVWDQQSAEALSSGGGDGPVFRVVGSPGLEAEYRSASKRNLGEQTKAQQHSPPIVLLAPSLRSERFLHSWLRICQEVTDSLGADEFTPVLRLRLHPSTPADARRSLRSSVGGAEADDGRPLASSLLLSAVVVTTSQSSLIWEANSLGVPVVMFEPGEVQTEEIGVLSADRCWFAATQDELRAALRAALGSQTARREDPELAAGVVGSTDRAAQQILRLLNQKTTGVLTG